MSRVPGVSPPLVPRACLGGMRVAGIDLAATRPRARLGGRMWRMSPGSGPTTIPGPLRWECGL